MPNYPTGTLVTAAEFNVICPVGVVLPFAGSAAPTNWLFCDGSAVLRSTYADLFAAIGTTYGAGDGSTTFNLPDAQGRAVVGKGSHADVSTLGNNDGVALANRRPKHNHTNGLTLPNHVHGITDPGHTHNPETYAFADSNPSNDKITQTQTSASPLGGQTANALTTDGTGISVGNPTTNPAISGVIGPAGTNPNDAAAYVVLNYIIKA